MHWHQRWKARYIKIMVVVVFQYAHLCSSESPPPTKPLSGAEFLRSVIEHLQRERAPPEDSAPPSGTPSAPPEPSRPSAPASTTRLQIQGAVDDTYKIIAPTPVPSQDVSAKVPPPPLSKAELLALYQAAVDKGASLANIARDPALTARLEKLQALLAAKGKPDSGAIPGYYYYYFPIKNLMEGVTTKMPEGETKDETHNNPMMGHMVPTSTMMTESDKNKNVEPLFMAIAGFVGMALMFAVSVLFLPKFSSLRSRGISALKNAPDEMLGLTKIVIEAIDGKDCTQRVICEAGRVMRKFHLNNKTIRVLEILLPPRISKKLVEIRKTAYRKKKCNNIPCKWKELMSVT